MPNWSIVWTKHSPNSTRKWRANGLNNNNHNTNNSITNTTHIHVHTFLHSNHLPLCPSSSPQHLLIGDVLIWHETNTNQMTKRSHTINTRKTTFDGWKKVKNMVLIREHTFTQEIWLNDEFLKCSSSPDKIAHNCFRRSHIHDRRLIHKFLVCWNEVCVGLEFNASRRMDTICVVVDYVFIFLPTYS